MINLHVLKPIVMRITKSGRLDHRFKGAAEAEAEGLMKLFFCLPIYILLYLGSILISGYNELLPSSLWLNDYLNNLSYTDNKVFIICTSIFTIIYFVSIVLSGLETLKDVLFKPLINSLFVVITCVFSYRFFNSIFSSESFYEGITNCFSVPEDNSYRNLLLIYLIIYVILITLMVIRLLINRKIEKASQEKINQQLDEVKKTRKKINDLISNDLDKK